MGAMVNGSHICVVVDDDCLERFGWAVRGLCVGLIDEAIRTTVVGPRSSGIDSLEIGPVRVQTYGSLAWLRRNRELADLVYRLSEDAPRVVHALSGETAPLAAHLAGALDIPLVVTLTGIDELTEQTAPILQSAANVVAVSEPIRTHALQRLERSAEDIVRVRWGLVAGQAPSCFLDEKKDPTLVAISPLVSHAGLEHLVDAMAQLARGQQRVLLFVLGSGPAENDLRRRVDGLGLNERVTFVGPIREWSTVLQGADVFIVPSGQHKLTIYPIAAMAAGVVVVASGGGDHDCLIDGQTARIYQPPSAELLAAVLAEVLADPSGSRRLAAAAQAYVAQHHRVSAMVAQTVQLYQQLALNQQTIPMPPTASVESGEG